MMVAVVSEASLPEEVLARVFTFLDRRSLMAASETCHRWNRIASDDAIWRSLYFDGIDAGTPAGANKREEEREEGEEVGASRLAPRQRFLHASPHSWRAADACGRARYLALRALSADRARETDELRERLGIVEDTVLTLAKDSECLKERLRAAHDELGDASYELMTRSHRLEEKTEEAARLARALLVAEKGREDEKRRADALECEAKALRERCNAAERSLELAAQRSAKEKKKRKELLDFLTQEQRPCNEVTRDTLAALLKQFLAPSSSSSSSTASSLESTAASAPSSSSTSSLLSERSSRPAVKAGQSAPATHRHNSQKTSVVDTRTTAPASAAASSLSSLYLQRKIQDKCNF